MVRKWNGTHSKNDSAYLTCKDWKPGGFEVADVRCVHTNAHKSTMHALMEMHCEKTSFFIRQFMPGSYSQKIP